MCPQHRLVLQHPMSSPSQFRPIWLPLKPISFQLVFQTIFIWEKSNSYSKTFHQCKMSKFLFVGSKTKLCHISNGFCLGSFWDFIIQHIHFLYSSSLNSLAPIFCPRAVIWLRCMFLPLSARWCVWLANFSAVRGGVGSLRRTSRLRWPFMDIP